MTRRFSPEPVDLRLIARLLDTARRAPSAGFSQGVHFVAFAGEDTTVFWRITGAGEWFTRTSPEVLDAPVVIVPVADPAAYTARYAEQDKAGHGLERADAWPVPFWLGDTAMATQNLLLLLEEAGLGALFFGLFRGESDLLERIGAPDGARVLGAVAVGRRRNDDSVSGSPVRRPRRAVDEVVHWGRW